MTSISAFSINGYYFDSRTSQRRTARVDFHDDDQVTVTLEEVEEFSLRMDELVFSPRIGNTPRIITLPGRAIVESPDNDVIDELLRRRSMGKGNAFVHLLESGARYVIPSIAVLVLTVWLVIQFLVPFAARRIAFALPASVTSEIGTKVLEILDQQVFSPSRLSKKKTARLSRRFGRMVASLPEKDDYAFKIIFRRGNQIGANAFALPNGTVIVTDEMVALSGNDNEIVAVLAHEIGHVVNRHGLRDIIQNSAVAVVLLFVTGDAFSTTSIVSALPALLLKGGYSRDFEREADLYSCNYLVKNKIPTRHFVSMLTKLQKEHDTTGVLNLFSTHPALDERIALFSVKGSSGEKK